MLGHWKHCRTEGWMRLAHWKAWQWAGGVMQGFRRATQRVACCVELVYGEKQFSCFAERGLVVRGPDSECLGDRALEVECKGGWFSVLHADHN